MIRAVGIGELCCGRAPGMLAAYGLGSCLAITLYDPPSRLGGMVHCLLPESDSDGTTSAGKYVSQAVQALLQQLLLFGANRDTLEVKMAGGARISPDLQPPEGSSVGARNIAAARRALRTCRLPLVAEDVAGNHGRNLFFDLTTGAVRVQRVHRRGRTLRL